MRLTPDFEKTLRRYVLGELDEGVRHELEELLVVDADAFEALGVIEDELVEEYLDEAWTKEERRRFEERVLTSPERSRRLRLARALRARAATGAPGVRAEGVVAQPGPAPTGPSGLGRRVPAWVETLGDWLRPPRWQPAWVGVAAVLALSLAANAWFASRYHALPPERRSLPAPAGTTTAVPSTAAATAERPHPPSAPPARVAELIAPPEDLEARLAREQQERSRAETRAAALEQALRRSRGPVLTFALAAGLRRGGGSLPRVTVPADAVAVRLRLELTATDYPRYRAALLDAEGDEIWTASKLDAESEGGRVAIVLLVPPSLLPRGDYQVKLSGVNEGEEPEPVATYTFRVEAP